MSGEAWYGITDESKRARGIREETPAFDFEEAERAIESETEPTGCYRALAWIRKSMGAAA